MRLLKLNIERLPGIPAPFKITAQEGVNLVLGPNESGKSSLAKTVKHLLWPTNTSNDPIVARGQFYHDGKTLQVASNFNNTVTWEMDGEQTNSPKLPAGHAASCYQLGIPDLLKSQASNLDQDLALEIRTRMAGGYDLTALSKLISDPSGEFSRKQKIWRLKKQKVEEIILKQAALYQDQNRLQELIGEADLAIRARDRSQLIQVAIQLEETRVSLIDLDLQINCFPVGMKNLHIGDAKTLTGYRKRLDEFQQQLKEQQDLCNQKQEALDILDLPEESDRCNTGLVAEILQECRQMRETWLELSRAVTGAEARLALEEDRIDPRVLASNGDTPLDLKELYQKLAKLFQTSMDLEASLRERKKQAEEAPLRELSQDSVTTHQELQKAAQTLSMAMERHSAFTGSLTMSKGSLLWGTLAFAAGITGGVISFLSTQNHNLEQIILGTFFLSTLAGGAMVIQWLKKRKLISTQRQSLQQIFHELGHPLPAGWTQNQARELVLEIECQITRTDVVLEAKNLLGKAQTQATDLSERNLVTAKQQRQQILQQHGLPSVMDQEDLLASLSTLERYLTAHSELESYRGKQHECAKQIETAEERARLEFASGNIHVIGRIDNLRDACDQLEKKRHLREALQQSQRDLQGQIASTASLIEHQEQEIKTLLERLELANDTEPELAVAKLIADQSKYLELKASQAAGISYSKRMKAELEAGDDILQLAEFSGKTVTDLGIMLEKEQTLALGAENLRNDIATIKTSIHSARGDRVLEDARAAEDDSHESLVDIFEQRRSAALAKVLVRETETAFEHNSRPKVLEEASRLFGIFTRSRYQLRVVTEDGKRERQVFRALSNEVEGRSLELVELSDGTRAQLLLAARLAFIKESETSAQPPIFLDEALTSSDPVRFAAIAGSLSKWAEESSRQIFYLTSNPADIAAWRTVLQSENLAEAHFIDLGAIRTDSIAADPDSFDSMAVDGIVPPGKLTAAEYGAKLKIPLLDPWAKENAAPIFYLLKDDLNLLHKLLQAGIFSLGNWRAQPEHLLTAGIITSNQLLHLEARGQILGAFLDAWLQGRGRPLNPGTLKACNILSDRMLGPAIKLLENVNGDAHKFLVGLNNGLVKRLQNSKKEELQSYLELNNYTDSRPILDSNQITNHIVKAVTAELASGTIDLSEIGTLVNQLIQTLTRQ